MSVCLSFSHEKSSLDEFSDMRRDVSRTSRQGNNVIEDDGESYDDDDGDGDGKDD